MVRIFVDRFCHLGLIQHNRDRAASALRHQSPWTAAAMSWPEEAARVRELRESDTGIIRSQGKCGYYGAKNLPRDT